MSKHRFEKFEDEDGDESEANWQDSYSDLMTDLLAIFVVLFSFAMMNQAIVAYNRSAAAQSQDVVSSQQVQILTGSDSALDGTTGVLDADNSILPNDDTVSNDTDNSSSANDNTNNLAESIDSYINKADLSDQLSIAEQEDHKIVLRVASSLLFDSGKAEITSNAEPVLAKLSQILIKFSDSITMIRVEGHTDNIPIHNSKFESNWELSTSRSVNVLSQLLEISKISPQKFTAIGYSEFHPIADNDTEDGRNKNRRVDIIIETVGE